MNDARTRIGLLSRRFHMGGAERWMIDVARHLDRRRVECIGMAIQDPNGAHHLLLQEASSVTTVVRGPEGTRALAARCDVLVYWGYADPPDGRTLVFVSHGCCGWTQKVARLAAARGHHLAAVSEASAGVFPNPAAAAVIYNGVDLTRCEPVLGRQETRRSWGVADDQVTVGYIGRIIGRTGNKNPVAAAHAAHALGPRYVPVFVGPIYSAQTKADILAACPRALFFPPSVQVGDALSALDCFVLASPSEGNSLALLEAWAGGVPTVATQVGAVPELERLHGRLTISVPVGPTVYEIADAVLRALSADNQVTIEKARRLVRSTYTIEAMGRNWTDYLLAVHKGRVGPTQAFQPAHPVVSVLVSAFNTQAKFLRDLWASLCAQTLASWELVMVDDGSTSPETIRALNRLAGDARVTLVRLPENRGMGAALNEGLRHCRADLVGHVDSDDIVMPEWLARASAGLLAQPWVDILGVQLERFDGETGEILGRTDHPAVIGDELIRRQLRDRQVWFLNHPGVVYRRSSIMKIGGYRGAARTCEDLDLWLRARRAGLQIRNLQEVLVRYRSHPGQATQQPDYRDDAVAVLRGFLLGVPSESPNGANVVDRETT